MATTIVKRYQIKMLVQDRFGTSERIVAKDYSEFEPARQWACGKVRSDRRYLSWTIEELTSSVRNVDGMISGSSMVTRTWTGNAAS